MTPQSAEDHPIVKSNGSGASAPVEPADIFSLIPRDFAGALKFAEMIASSDLAPKDFKAKPSNVLVAIQLGAELGLKPMQALQNIAVINGRPSLWGDAVKAIVESSPACELLEEDPPDVALKNGMGRCTVKRRGDSKPYTVTFSIEDAKTAGLWGKEGPWRHYPGRMLQMRARAWACRDKFADVLKGLPLSEEILEIPAGDVRVVNEPASAPEPVKPATQEDKGAAVRERILSAKPAAERPAAKITLPWEEFVETWEREHPEELAAVSADNGIRDVRGLPIEARAAFRQAMIERIQAARNDGGLPL